jgi:hypothetical protein
MLVSELTKAFMMKEERERGSRRLDDDEARTSETD